MYVQFCNEAKSCAYWLVNETVWYETETRQRHDFQSETRSRSRPSHVSTRPRRDRDVWKLRLETETSRPRLHACSELVKIGLVRLVLVTTKVRINGLTNITTVNSSFFISYVTSMANSSPSCRTVLRCTEHVKQPSCL